MASRPTGRAKELLDRGLAKRSVAPWYGRQ